MKSSAPSAVFCEQSASLPGRRSLRAARLAVDFLVLAAAQPLFGALDDEVEQLAAAFGIVGEAMVEGVAQRVFDEALGLGRGQPVLGLAQEFRLADEDRQHAAGRDHHVVGGDLRGALVLRQLGVGLQALGQRGAQAGLVRAAFGRRDGVAVGMELRIAAIPGDGPFERAVAAGLFGPAGEDLAGDREVLADRCRR